VLFICWKRFLKSHFAHQIHYIKWLWSWLLRIFTSQGYSALHLAANDGMTSFICVIWLIHVCDMTRSFVWHDSFMCRTWLMSMCDMAHSCVRSIHTCDVTRAYVCHDSFVCATWLVRMCDVTHPYVWHDSFTRVTLLIYVVLFKSDAQQHVMLTHPYACCLFDTSRHE